ncbi:MAG: class C beta-lactamase-related serine hydrolase [Geminicoccaceae bacterium]|nr:MAG: class C beta-lactamase-related serine hydrolase [Geminicoccaceae bacterium]
MSYSRRTALGLFAANSLAGPALAVPARRLDARLLERAAATARGLDQLHALVVAVDGTTVMAERFRGPPLARAVNIKSLSKTVHATVAGLAIDQGILEAVDQEVAPFLQADFPPRPDPRLFRLTVDHLLTMRAGLGRTSGAHYGRWVASPNWVRTALAEPFVDEPGGRMLYSTGSYHLLSAVLSRASGRSLRQLTRELLGDPLGIEVPPWVRDPQGLYLGGNDMALTPDALIRLGELYRRGGVWDGRHVLSRTRIEAAWTPRTASPFSGDAYGYGWFVTRLGGQHSFYGRGFGGQMLYVVPRAGLTVAMTSDPTRPARSGGHVADLHHLMSAFLIPAVA